MSKRAVISWSKTFLALVNCIHDLPQIGKFLLDEIFVGKIFVLKKFCRVDVLQKYFNTKIFTT